MVAGLMSLPLAPSAAEAVPVSAITPAAAGLAGEFCCELDLWFSGTLGGSTTDAAPGEQATPERTLRVNTLPRTTTRAPANGQATNTLLPPGPLMSLPAVTLESAAAQSVSPPATSDPPLQTEGLLPEGEGQTPRGPRRLPIAFAARLTQISMPSGSPHLTGNHDSGPTQGAAPAGGGTGHPPEGLRQMTSATSGSLNDEAPPRQEGTPPTLTPDQKTSRTSASAPEVAPNRGEMGGSPERFDSKSTLASGTSQGGVPHEEETEPTSFGVVRKATLASSSGGEAPLHQEATARTVGVEIHRPGLDAAPHSRQGAVQDVSTPPNPANGGPSRQLATIEEAARTSQTAHRIELRLGRPGTEGVDVQVADQAGRVRVAVRTADHDLASSLREGLSTLVSRLDVAGFRSQTWIPAGAATIGRGAEDTAAAGQDSGRGAGSGAGGQQHGEQSEQQDEDRRHEPPAWIQNLEHPLAPDAGNTKERDLWKQLLRR